MNETLRGTLERLRTWLERYTPRQKRNIIIALVAAIICVASIGYVLTRPHYVAVVTGQDSKSLGEVQTQLDTLKIPNEIQGSSILVPAADANTARVQLAMAGLPKSGYIGYNIPNSFGMTQDQFNIQVLDQLQQSLNATIQSIDGIDAAQVHIVMPQQQLFVSQPQSTAKASVFIQVAPGVQLSAAQVEGIQQLVAHSINGLSASDVAVVDQNGVTLSSVGASSATLQTFAGQTELTARQQLEQQLTNQITMGLDQIVGSGNSVVMVHANLTFNQTSTKSHVVTPAAGGQTGLPTSSQSIRKSSTSPNAVTGGAAGVSSTNPGLQTYAGSNASGNNSTTSDTESTINYDNNYTDQTTIADPVQLNGFTVGIFLNSSDKALTKPVLQQIKAFVANAVGMKAGASSVNNITVATIPFQTSTPVSFNSSTGLKLPSWALAGLGALVLLGGGVVVLRNRRRGRAEADSPKPAFSPAVVEDLEQAQTEEEVMRDQLVRLANQKPDEFSNLLRGWLMSD